MKMKNIKNNVGQKKMICEMCMNHFEYDEGKTYDCDTFICFECADEIATQTINWGIKNG